MSRSTEPVLPVVPVPTVRHLPRYLHALQVLRQRGRQVVSVNHIADDLGLDPTQVRKNLAYTGLAGRPKVGYATEDLIVAIETLLGWPKTDEAFLVGVGALGTALGLSPARTYGVATFHSHFALAPHSTARTASRLR
jgi:redox-sensing transcriptional repressor